MDNKSKAILILSIVIVIMGCMIGYMMQGNSDDDAIDRAKREERIKLEKIHAAELEETVEVYEARADSVSSIRQEKEIVIVEIEKQEKDEVYHIPMLSTDSVGRVLARRLTP